MQPTSGFKFRKIYIILPILLVLIVAGVIIFFVSSPGSNNLNLTALLSQIAGIVEVQNNTQSAFNQVQDGFLLKGTMQLQTKTDSKVRLDLSTGAVVRLGPTTIFSLESEQANSTGGLSTISLQVGNLWAIIQGGTLNVNTPGGLASVRGSYMSVEVDPTANRITVTCLEGTCTFADKAGQVTFTSGQKIISTNPNVLPVIQKMDKADIQSWLDNNPEIATIVNQVTIILASSTPASTQLASNGTPAPTGVIPLTSGSTATPVTTTTPATTQTVSPTPASTQLAFLSTQQPTTQATSSNNQSTPQATQVTSPTATQVSSQPTQAATQAATNTPQSTQAPTQVATNPPQPTQAPTLVATNTPQPTQAPTQVATKTPQPTITPTPSTPSTPPPRTTGKGNGKDNGLLSCLVHSNEPSHCKHQGSLSQIISSFFEGIFVSLDRLMI